MLGLESMIAQDLFICPRCASSVRPQRDSWNCDNAECRYAREAFPVIAGLPALVDFENSVLDPERIRATEGASVIRRAGSLKHSLRRLLQGRNRVSANAIAHMLTLVRLNDPRTIGSPPRILIVGGGTAGSGLEQLYEDPTIDLVAFDVYASPLVQFVGDGHAIPLSADSVDGVIVQGVLNYVLDPKTVVREIHRVLRTNGIVYADAAFMQQVVEGPYDFLRFTDSGLRYLFRDFELIDSGAVAGAGSALVWSIGYFARAVFRSIAAGRLAQLFFFWLRYVDVFLDAKYSIDAASGVYFVGRKATAAITGTEIISYYQGGL